jgi:flagellar basal body-associated protein FliL
MQGRHSWPIGINIIIITIITIIITIIIMVMTIMTISQRMIRALMMQRLLPFSVRPPSISDTNYAPAAAAVSKIKTSHKKENAKGAKKTNILQNYTHQQKKEQQLKLHSLLIVQSSFVRRMAKERAVL